MATQHHTNGKAFIAGPRGTNGKSLNEAILAERLLESRRARSEIIDGDFLGEPAWDMLLDLFIARERGTTVSISNACVASAAPATTALRYIGMLERQGHIERVQDSHDRRRVFLRISDKMHARMRSYLRDYASQYEKAIA